MSGYLSWYATPRISCTANSRLLEQLYTSTVIIKVMRYLFAAVSLIQFSRSALAAAAPTLFELQK